MPTEDSIVERDEPTYRWSAIIFLVFVIFQVIACEASVIHGLWFKEVTQDHVVRYLFPLLIAFPATFLVIFRVQARGWVAHGKLTSGLAARIINNFGVALFVAYICIFQLAEMAFNAR